MRYRQLTTMDNKLYYTIIGLVLGLLLTTLYLYQQNNTLEHRLETLGFNFDNYVKCKSKDSFELAVQQFKEDSYIRQQQHDTDLILIIIPIFFGLFAALTYTAAERKFKSYTDITEKKYEEQDRKNKTYHNYAEKMKGDLHYEIYLNRMFSVLVYKQLNKPMAIHWTLAALSHLTGSYIVRERHDKLSSAELITKTIKDLNELLVYIGEQVVNMEEVEEVNINGSIKSIMEINNLEINKLLVQIRLKMIFNK